jgi:hypothetical protein
VIITIAGYRTVKARVAAYIPVAMGLPRNRSDQLNGHVRPGRDADRGLVIPATLNDSAGTLMRGTIKRKIGVGNRPRTNGGAVLGPTSAAW